MDAKKMNWLRFFPLQVASILAATLNAYAQGTLQNPKFEAANGCSYPSNHIEVPMNCVLHPS
jgi:hypothetical protein